MTQFHVWGTAEVAVRAGNIPGAAAAGREQHRLHRQFRAAPRHLQPVLRHRATDTISTEAVSYGRIAL